MADVTVANTSPGIAGKTLACHDADGTTSGIWTFANQLALKCGTPGVVTWRLKGETSNNVSLLADGSGTGLTMNTGGAAIFNGDITEKNRTTPLGHWIDVPFNAANFTASAGVWTIGSQVTNSYTLIGKTLVYQVELQGCTISASPATLMMALPAGLSVSKLVVGTVAYTNGGVAGRGTIYIATGASALSLVRDLAFTPWAADGGGTTIYGYIIAPLV